ncbi:hypothetical protein DFH28DRAFT_988308 [Melampsora americana]|nr:hypothetical protein DFH28DRAFT_988308 [Melampsora americana]
MKQAHFSLILMIPIVFFQLEASIGRKLSFTGITQDDLAEPRKWYPPEERWEGDLRQNFQNFPTNDVHKHQNHLGPKSPLTSMYKEYNKNVYPSASKGDKYFWDMHTKYFHHHKSIYVNFLHSMNDLLCSEENTWAGMVPGLFEETKGDEVKQVLLFWFFRNLAAFYEVPIKTTQMIHEYLAILGLPVDHWKDIGIPERWQKLDIYNWFEGIDPGRFSRVISPYWSDHFERTRNLYTAEMVTKIQSLATVKDLEYFEHIQKEFPMTGLKLGGGGHWSEQEEKELLSFWISHRDLYSKICSDPVLQKVLETQIVQTRLIQRVQKSKERRQKYKSLSMDETESRLKFYSNTILDFIQNLDSVKTLDAFLSAQSQIKTYGMVIPPNFKKVEKINIIQFWTKYVTVFLDMCEFGETPNLQMFIGELVKKDFTKMSEIMEDFLFKYDGHVFNVKFPICDQYLEIAGNPKFGYNIKGAYRACKIFRIKNATNRLRYRVTL